ncbi:ABC transporter substrate-binding protein [Microvirga alba]|uniref:Solute-binding protein family 5 domain-containing protein n=1 Tax=Microvirga alba TaxID=2791025 RepID=A0A931BQJ4_9HYPH|nr:ABC transporter substrate-binding protein [Microvirga alba]MBF9233829.1 hypothetical protein [Microvirga alba]
MKRRTFLSGMALLPGTLMSAPVPAWAQSGKKTFKGTLVVAASLDPKNFNTNYDTFGGANYINFNIMSKLVKYDHVKNEIFPDLATSWEIAPDLKTYTFKLRPGVKWHDGKPFTSADVKWTIEDIVREGDRAATYKFVSDIERVETPDDLTAVLRLARPNGIIIQNFASYNGFNILPKHLYEGSSVRDNPANLKPVGTGPFRFVEYVVGSHVLLEPNPNYYGEGPYLERLAFQILPNLSTALMALEAGQVGYVTASPPFADAARLKSVKGIAIDSTPSTIVMWFGFNFDKPMWRDIRLRRAVSMAINRDELVGKLYLNLVKPAWGHFTSAVPWANDATARQPEFNLAEAERLLDEAGYKKGADGIRMTVQMIVFPTNIWGSVEQAQMVKQQLSAVGIRVDVKVVEFALRVEEINKRGFDFVHGGGTRGPDPSEMIDYYESKSSRNNMKYSNPKVDELFIAGRASVDQGERTKIYSEIQKILAADQPMVPMVEYSYLRPYRQEYRGFSWHPEAAGKASEHMYNLVRLA